MLGFPYAPKEVGPWQRAGRATRAARRRSRRAWRRPARARWARPVARPPGRVVAATVPIRARSARAWRKPAREPGQAPRAPGAEPRADCARSSGAGDDDQDRSASACHGLARRRARGGPDRGVGAGGQPAAPCTSRDAGENTAGDHAGRAVLHGPGHRPSAEQAAGTLRGGDRPGRPRRRSGHGAAPAGYRRCCHHAGHPAPGHAGWEPERPAEVSLLGLVDDLEAREAAVVVINLAAIARVAPVRDLATLVARGALQPVLVQVDHVPALAGVVLQALPGNRVIAVADAEEAAERQDGVLDLA